MRTISNTMLNTILLTFVFESFFFHFLRFKLNILTICLFKNSIAVNSDIFIPQLYIYFIIDIIY